MPLGKRIGTDEHCRANDIFGEGWTDARSMADDEVSAESYRILRWDPVVSEETKAGIHAIYGLIGCQQIFNAIGTILNAFECLLVEGDLGAMTGDRLYLREGQIVAIKNDGLGFGHVECP